MCIYEGSTSSADTTHAVFPPLYDQTIQLSNLFHNKTYLTGAVDALFSINAAGRINNDVIEAFKLHDTYPCDHPSYRTATRRIEQSTSFRRITVK